MLPPLLMGLVSGKVAFNRQTGQQLRTAKGGPSLGGLVEGGSEFVGLGHEVTRTGSGHPPSVAPFLRVLHLPFDRIALSTAVASAASGFAPPGWLCSGEHSITAWP